MYSAKLQSNQLHHIQDETFKIEFRPKHVVEIYRFVKSKVGITKFLSDC